MRRAPEPLIPLRLFCGPHDRRRGAGEHRRRCRDVRHDRLPHAVHADRAGQVADGERPAHDPDGRRPPAVVGRRRADRQPDGRLQAVHGLRGDAADRRPAADGDDRRDDPPRRARWCSWSSSARASGCSCRTSSWSCRTRCGWRTSARVRRSSPSCARSAARSAYRRSARCSRTTRARRSSPACAGLGVDPGAAGGDAVPDVSSLPAPVAHVVEHGYGTAIGEIFLVAAPLGLLVVFADALAAGEAARAPQRDRAARRRGPGAAAA